MVSDLVKMKKKKKKRPTGSEEDVASKHESEAGCPWNPLDSSYYNMGFCLPWIQLYKGSQLADRKTTNPLLVIN